MVPMMSAVFLLDALISLIVVTTRCTTRPPLPATSAATAASWLAAREVSALCCTVEVICCMDAAVCWSALACCSVRLDRSRLPDAISEDAVTMPSADCRTCTTQVTKLRFILLRAQSSKPVSSWRSTTMSERRSPAATASASATQRSSGRVTAEASSQPMASAIGTAALHTDTRVNRSPAKLCSAMFTRRADSSWSEAMSSWVAFNNAASSGRQSAFMRAIEASLRPASALPTMSAATGPYRLSMRTISATSAGSRSVTSVACATAPLSLSIEVPTSASAVVTAALSSSTSLGPVTSTRLRAAMARAKAAPRICVASRSTVARNAR